MGVENIDVSGGNCFMNSHTISEANNLKIIYSTNKGDKSVPSVYEMENIGIQYGFESDVMLPAFALHKYVNM